MSKFKEMLQASFKSEDTEEWLDVHFTRPVGLVFAIVWNKLGVHPNAVTILSIFLGVASAAMFYHEDTAHNIAGVALLMLANFCDSTDGQMARLTGKKTLIGRMLDGFSGDVWFAAIYIAICLRLQGATVPLTDQKWGVAVWVLAVLAGIMSHSPQSSLSDYYRQIHLYFLKGRGGSELDSYAGQMETLAALPAKGAFWHRVFHSNYAKYCKSQERRTPEFQRFRRLWEEGGKESPEAEAVKSRFIEGSRPLMKYTNLLTFNTRAICIYATCLLGCPWVYLIVEITIMNLMYTHMHRRHEKLCRACAAQITEADGGER